MNGIFGFLMLVTGVCSLSISLFCPGWFAEGGMLRKKYYGDDGRVIYAMLGVFFVIGGIAFLFFPR